MPGIGLPELLLLLVPFAGFVIVVGGLYLLGNVLKPSKQAQRLAELEREVAELKSRQQ